LIEGVYCALISLFEKEKMTQSPLDNLDLIVDLPDLIKSIEKISPRLLPYEHAVYWYLFKRAVIKQFNVNIEVSIGQISMAIPFKMTSVKLNII
jgi:hypothetical protein